MSKTVGEIGELAFLYRAHLEGLSVSRPYGDNQPYDFIVDNGITLNKVQVKSALTLGPKSRYRFKLCPGGSVNSVDYESLNVDFIIANIFMLDIWLVIPCVEVQCKYLSFRPDKAKDSRWGKYVGRWDLLKATHTPE